MGCEFCGPKVKDLDEKISRATVTLSLNLDNEELVGIQALNGLRIPNLNVFSVKHNKLSSLPQTFLESCKSLKKLDASENFFETLEDCVFINQKLTYLNFSYNSLTTVDIRFNKLLSLKELNLSGNKIVFIDDAVCFANLEVLDLSYNAIKKLPSDLITSPKLELLNLQNNELTELPENWGDSQINTLNVESNKISTLPNGIFEQSKLVNLNLRNNKINIIELQSYRGYKEYQNRVFIKRSGSISNYSNTETCGL